MADTTPQASEAAPEAPAPAPFDPFQGLRNAVAAMRDKSNIDMPTRMHRMESTVHQIADLILRNAPPPEQTPPQG